MKFIAKTLACFGALLVAAQLYAMPRHDLPCPSISAVQSNAKFVMAEKVFDSYWGLVARSFSENDNSWNVALAVMLPDVTDPNEALKQGQDYFNENVMLEEPVVMHENSYQLCVYTKSKEAVVFAINPAIDMGAISLFKKIK